MAPRAREARAADGRASPVPPIALRETMPATQGSRRVSLFVALVATSVLPASARAEADAPESVHLVWVRSERTDACASGSEIARRVSTRLGRNVFSEGAARSIEGVVQHEGEKWSAHIYVRDRDGKLTGSRDLTTEAVDCAPLEAAVILAIALAIDPDAALRPPQPSAVPTPPPAAAPTAVVPPPPAPPPPVQSPSPYLCPPERPCPQALAPAEPIRGVSGTTTSLRALAATGLLPAISPGIAVSADVPLYRALHGTAGAFLLPEVRTAAQDFGFGLTAAWLGLCVEPWAWSGGALSACGSVLGGAIHSVVYALEPTQPGDRPWAGASLGGRARTRLVGPFAVEAGLELVAPLTRQRFLVEGQPAAIFQEPSVAGLGFLGLGLTFP